ncbi:MULTISPECIES: serine/threonine-protein kinase [unclassified Streptomyces]|uniref:serine/threonine protein kinase n=1 Tax=unclassified Streptomyces TaxID=2593676 RepID=UPI00039F7E01|nr:serine/threonine-protein kinase [Streptomyces sp. BoleA5]MYX32678.1 protein kinase [Streptomyces sp. SID8377]
MEWNAPQPQWIGSYRIVARLGQGGMGQVFLGRSPGGMKVAVKVIRPDIAEDDEFRRRFAREAQAARQVNSAYTAAVVGADAEADPPWLATAYVQGVPLDKALRHGPWPSDSVRALGAGLVEALSAIHEAGVIHRDLKPSNVILTSNGPRVIDFGISAVMDATRLTEHGSYLGTAGFSSPEQIKGQAVGTASDVFSLGVLLTRTATGRYPFGEAASGSVLNYRVVHEQPDMDRLPPELRAIIEPCLAKDPALRPRLGELLHQLIEPVDDLVTVLGTAAWLPPAVAAMTALREAEDTVGLRQADAGQNDAAGDKAIAHPTEPDNPAQQVTDPAVAFPAEVAVANTPTQPGSRAARRTADRTVQRRARRVAPLVTAGATALVLVATGGWWWSQHMDEATGTPSEGASKASGAVKTPSPSPSASIPGRPSGSPSAKSPAKTSGTRGSSTTPTRSAKSSATTKPPSEPALGLDWKCRNSYVADNADGYWVLPCIADDTGNSIAYKIQAKSPTAQTLTFYYWLGRNPEDGSRDDITLSYVQECTLHMVPNVVQQCPVRTSRPSVGEVHAGVSDTKGSLDGANSNAMYFDGQHLSDMPS